MNTARTPTRISAIFLSLSLALPSPALALRPAQSRDTGLEERITEALTGLEEGKQAIAKLELDPREKETRELIRRLQQDGSDEPAMNQLIALHRGRIIRRARSGFNWSGRSRMRVPLQDMVDSAEEGLRDAVYDFDLTRGIPFIHFADGKIKGRIADRIVQGDLFSRPHRYLLNPALVGIYGEAVSAIETKGKRSTAARILAEDPAAGPGFTEAMKKLFNTPAQKANPKFKEALELFHKLEQKSAKAADKDFQERREAVKKEGWPSAGLEEDEEFIAELDPELMARLDGELQELIRDFLVPGVFRLVGMSDEERQRRYVALLDKLPSYSQSIPGSGLFLNRLHELAQKDIRSAMSFNNWVPLLRWIHSNILLPAGVALAPGRPDPGEADRIYIIPVSGYELFQSADPSNPSHPVIYGFFEHPLVPAMWGGLHWFGLAYVSLRYSRSWKPASLEEARKELKRIRFEELHHGADPPELTNGAHLNYMNQGGSILGLMNGEQVPRRNPVDQRSDIAELRVRIRELLLGAAPDKERVYRDLISYLPEHIGDAWDGNAVFDAQPVHGFFYYWMISQFLENYTRSSPPPIDRVQEVARQAWEQEFPGDPVDPGLQQSSPSSSKSANRQLNRLAKISYGRIVENEIQEARGHLRLAQGIFVQMRGDKLELLIAKSQLNPSLSEQASVKVLAQKSIAPDALMLFTASEQQMEILPESAEEVRRRIEDADEEEGGPVVVALDASIQPDMVAPYLPTVHPVVVLLESGKWEQYLGIARMILRTPLAALRNRILRLTGGPVRTVVIEGEEYVTILAQAA